MDDLLKSMGFFTRESFIKAMTAYNQVKFTPLAKMTEAERLELANRFDALTSEVQPSDYDTIMNDRQPKIME